MLFSVIIASCVTNVTGDNRILGGERAPDNDQLYYARIGRRSTVGRITWNCGGAIIERRWILTSANCVVQIPDTQFVVAVGARSIEDHGTTMPVDRVFQHPQYDASTHKNDIGLVRTRTLIDFDDENVKRIGLSLGNSPPPQHHYLILGGWGVSDTWHSISSSTME